MENRLTELSGVCVETHEITDIIEHLEEECIELLLSIKRLRRGKGSFEDFVEELTDVKIECNTVFSLLDKYEHKELCDSMLNSKLDKFGRMLLEENIFSLKKVSRYKDIEL